MPLQHHPLEHIVNVKWGEGLAVDINGYLSLKPDDPDKPPQFAKFNKTTMAFWFRIPDLTMSKAQGDYTARYPWNQYIDIDYTLLGIVPLVTFGPRSSYAYRLFTVRQSWFAQTGWIGYFCGLIPGTEVPQRHLVIRINGLSATISLGDVDITGEDFYAIGNQDGLMLMVRDVGDPGSTGNWDRIQAEPDQWHHLIISWDLSSNPGKLYLALDDQNHNGDALWPCGLKSLGLGDGMNDFGSSYYSFTAEGDWTGPAANTNITHKPFAIPTTLAQNYNIQMAEFIMCNDKVLDTSIEKNRRIFVDKDGKPVTGSDMAEALGRWPDMYLHGTSKWQEGLAYGAAELTEPAPDAVEMFSTSGSIEKYEPDPSLTPHT